MIGFFPPLHLGEEFDSGVARFHDLVLGENAKRTSEILFGNHKNQSNYFPSNLDYFVEQVSLTCPISVQEIIARHSVFPYLRPFVSKELTSRLLAGMRGSGVGHDAARVFGASNLARRFRFCPICARENRKDFGEAYWHRLHQIGPVLVCPIHLAFLQESEDLRGESSRFVLAEDSIPLDSKIRSLNLSDPFERFLLWLAEQISWLLYHPDLTIDIDRVRELHHSHLTAQNLLKIGFKNQFGPLRNAIYSRLPRESIQRLGIGKVREVGSDWIADVVLRGRGSPKGRGSPLQHLLIVYALDLNIQKFLIGVGQDLLFENGPWPCLNPICLNYQKPVITEYTPVRETTVVSGRFECSCGFKYSRTAPDRDGASRGDPRRVLERGTLWDTSLISLWNDASQTIKEIARKLGVDFHTIWRAAIRLNLPSHAFRGENKKVRNWKLHTSNTSMIDHKQRIIDYQSSHANATRSEIWRGCEYSALVVRRADPNWFSINMPPRQNFRSTENRRDDIDWKARDVSMAAQVRLIHDKLLSLPRRPSKISKHRLVRELGISEAYFSKGQLPKTAAALGSVVETSEQYAVRRLQWAASHHSVASIREVIRAARIGEKLLKLPRVRKVLEDLERALPEADEA